MNAESAGETFGMTQTVPKFLGLTRTEWLLGVSALLVVGLLVHPYRAQQASRYALTAAVVERGTVVLDDYAPVLGRDRAIRDGHVYSDKAPGQPFMAVPVYAIGRLVGVEDATTLRIDGNLGLWWVTFWSSALPGAALAVMMYRRASSLQCRGALFGSVAVFAGTLLLPFSALLFGHVLAAALLFGSYLLLSGRGSVRRLVLAGVLAGLAVVVEYTAVLGIMVLGLYALRRHRRSALVWVAGGVPMAFGLAAYNAAAFGDPLTLSYQYNAFNEVTDTSRPVFAMFSAARLDNIFRLLFDGRGLLLGTPVVLVGLGGAISKLRRGVQLDALIALAMFSAFIWIPVLWANPWGGASPGPRYLTPALPFLVLPVVWAWERWPRLTVFASSVSVLTMLTATMTDPLLARGTHDGLNRWIQWVISGELTQTLFTLAIGRTGWLIHALLVLTALVLLLRSHGPAKPELNTR